VTFHALKRPRPLWAPRWFNLGDRTSHADPSHRLLAEGKTLSQAADSFDALLVKSRILPDVRRTLLTMIDSTEGLLHFGYPMKHRT